MSARRAEVVQPIIPATDRGQFAGFQNEPSPRDMAHTFSIRVPELNPTQLNQQELHLLILTFHTALIKNDTHCPQALLTLQAGIAQLEQDKGNVLAAHLLASAFGEVKPNDRENIGLVAVYLALHHNIAEALQRQEQTARLIANAVYTILKALEQILQDLKQEQQHLEKQQKADQQTRGAFAQNVYAGYRQNASFGNEAVEATEGFVAEDELGLKAVKKQQKQIELFLVQLNSVYIEIIFSI